MHTYSAPVHTDLAPVHTALVAMPTDSAPVHTDFAPVSVLTRSATDVIPLERSEHGAFLGRSLQVDNAADGRDAANASQAQVDQFCMQSPCLFLAQSL
jgi:hypothetical protein